MVALAVSAVSLLGQVERTEAAGFIGNIERFAGGPGTGSATGLGMEPDAFSTTQHGNANRLPPGVPLPPGARSSVGGQSGSL